MRLAAATWQKKDGCLMRDYGQGRRGPHIENLGLDRFRDFIDEAKSCDLDIMFEIKNKQKRALVLKARLPR